MALEHSWDRRARTAASRGRSVLGVVVVGVLMLAGAVGADAGATLRPMSVTTAAAAAGAGVRPVAPADRLIARPWLARRADGTWLTGRTGRATALGRHEVGLAVGNGWLITADDRSLGRSITSRRVDGSGGRTTAIDVIPASVAIAGSTAYIGGFDRATSGDPGLDAIDLGGGGVRELIRSSKGAHPRSVVAAPDGSAIVSATCDGAGTCDLTAVTAVGAVPAVAASTVSAPGYLRGTTSTVAVVGPDPASWIAGIDLASGRALWRHDALEMWAGYTTIDGRLLQAELRETANGPTFTVQAVATATGATTTLMTAAVGHGIGLWPELSSDDAFAIGPAYSLEDALARADGSPITVRLFAVADGRELGTVSIDGSGDR